MACCVKATVGLGRFVDVQLYDESMYLSWGRHLLRDGFYSAEWGPVYQLWYWLLSLVRSDQFDLYVTNRTLILWMLPLIAYAAMRLGGARPLVSTALATFVLIANHTIMYSPSVSQFAALVVLLTTAAAGLIADDSRRYWLISTGLVVLSYVRPEQSLALILWLVGPWVIPRLRDTARQAWRDRTAAATFAAISVGALVLIGVPMQGSGHRGFEAFAQHYAQQHWPPDAPPGYDSWRDGHFVIARDFPGASSITAAAAINPVALGRHVAGNIERYVQLPIMILPSYGAAVSPTVRRTGKTVTIIALVAGAAVAIRRRAQARGRAPAAMRSIEALWLVISVPTVAACVLISANYTTSQWTLGLALLALWLNLARRPPAGIAAAIACGIALWVVVPTPSTLTPPDGRPILDSVRFLRSALAGPVVMVDAIGGIANYLDPDATWVPDYDKGSMPFAEFAKQRGVNAILVSESLTTQHTYRDDPTFTSIVADPAAHGFIRTDIPIRNWYVLRTNAATDSRNRIGGRRGDPGTGGATTR